MNWFKTHLMADYDNNGVVRSLVKVYSMFFLNRDSLQMLFSQLIEMLFYPISLKIYPNLDSTKMVFKVF